MQPAKKVSPVIIALIVIVLIGIGTAVAVVANQSKETAKVDAITAESTKTEEPQTDTSATASEGASYKDGTYTEKGKYVSPGGAESIDVTVTVANDIITTVSVTPNATRGEAKERQDDFVGAFKNLVVGKNIDEVKLSRVAGASLTSNGFNSALNLIKNDAKA